MDEKDARRREKRANKARRAHFRRQGMVRAVRELVLAVVELRAWPRPVDRDLQGLPAGHFIAPISFRQFATGLRFEAVDIAASVDGCTFVHAYGEGRGVVLPASCVPPAPKMRHSVLKNNTRKNV